MPFTPILATLGYVFSADGTSILMVHRTARGESDPHFGKYNGLGGKLQRDEDIVAGMRREIFEEAGILCEELHLAGTISWPGFGRNGEDWFGFLFRVLKWSGAPREANDEGPLRWIPIGEVMQLPLWAGDRHFLPWVLDRNASPFHGVMPYAHGVPQSWGVTTLHEPRVTTRGDA